MSSNDYAIQISDLGKCYYIYSQPMDRLKQSVASCFSRLTRKPLRPYYREFWALRNLNLEINKGDVVGVIGRNGSGKSTLLQMIAGTLMPTTGTIRTHGRITALLELGSGFNPEFTGRENIFLNGAILGIGEQEIRERLNDIIRFADIGDFIDQPVRSYSSGMVVRLAFAVQVMLEPDILIVDEALSVGDEKFQRKCFQHIQNLRDKGVTILFVSHSMQEIIQICNRALLLEQGQRLLFASPMQVVKAYHRLIYAKDDEQKLLVLEQIKEIDDQSPVSLVDNLDTITPRLDTITPRLDSNFEKNETGYFDFFDDQMKPESTQILPENGARIEHIRILNSNGQEVNNLVSKREYLLELSTVFLSNQKDVRFIVHIHTKLGLNLFICSYPSFTDYVHDVISGQRYKLTCKLVINLVPGIYFVSAGLWSSQDVLLHQVRDLTMFRVLDCIESKYVSGLLDLSVIPPTIELV